MTTALSALHDQLRAKPTGFLLVLVYAFGIYTYVGLPLGGLPLPAAVAGLAGALLIVNNRHRIPRRHLTALVLILVVPALTLGLAPSPARMLEERLMGLIYFCYSLTASYGLYLELTGWPRRAVTALLAVGVGVLIGGVVLELFTPFRAVSDTFRAYFLGVNPRSSDLRELHMAGGLRPKLFTSETSHLAKWFVLVTVCWFALSRTPKRYAIMLAVAIAGALLIRSPITLGTFVGAGIVALYVDREGGLTGMLRRGDARRMAVTLLLGIGAVLLLAATVLTVLRGRALAAVSGQDFSTLIRLVAPIFIADRALSEYPLFGVGLSGNELLLPQITDAFVSLGIPLSSFASEENMINKITNAFWLHWIYLGLAGGVLQLMAYRAGLRMLGVRHIAFVALLAVMFGNFQGAYHGIRIWSTIFLTLVVATFLRSDATGTAPGPVRVGTPSPHEVIHG